MTEQKVKIYYNSDFTARAVKLGDWPTKTRGYNFSYPVLNTIDITNLLIDGGETKISAERMGTSIWSFNADTSILSITKKGEKQESKIDDVGELYQAMTDYFNEHKDDLVKKSIHSTKARVMTGKSKSEKSQVTPEEHLTDEEFTKQMKDILYPINCKAVNIYPWLFKMTQEQGQILLSKNLISKAALARVFFKGNDFEFFLKYYKQPHESDFFDDFENAHFKALSKEFNI